MTSEASYDRLVDAIYEASLQPDLWRNTIDALNEAFDVPYSSIFTPFTAKLNLAPIWSSNVDASFITDYATKYAHNDIFYGPLLQRIPAESLIWCWDDLADRSTFQDWDFYRDLCLSRNVRQGIGIMVNTEDYRAAQVTIYSGDYSQGYVDKAKKQLARLEKHLRKSLRIHWHLEAARSMAGQAQLTLDMFRTAVAWLGSDGAVLYSNAEFNDLATNTDGLSLLKGRLRLDDGHAQNSFVAAIAAAGNGQETNLLIPRESQNEPMYARVMPLPHAASALRFPSAKAILFLSGPAFAEEKALDIVAKNYGLSPAECRILKLLVSGRTAKSMANHLGLSEHTVRSQIKSIMSKCQVSRQADLLLLAATSQRP